MNELIQTLAVYALPVLFAITLHEAAHAFAAKRFGDTTAFALGRMSLDPVKHIDVFGTIVLPLVSYIWLGFPFGYAKPVPVDFGKLRKPKRDMAWVALAGPAANFVMALLWLILSRILDASGLHIKFFVEMTHAGIWVNLLLFALNLFPLPPLDGGRVMVSILPHKYAYRFAQIEPYGFFIVILLVSFQLMDRWMEPIVSGADAALRFLVYPLKFLLY